VCHLH